MASVYSHCHVFSHSLSLKLQLGVWNGTKTRQLQWAEPIPGKVWSLKWKRYVDVPFMISQWASFLNCVPSEKQTHRSNRSKEWKRRWCHLGDSGTSRGNRRREDISSEGTVRKHKPLRSGSSLFSRTSRASVPSSIRSSLVITPMVLRPTAGPRTEHVRHLYGTVVYTSCHCSPLAF